MGLFELTISIKINSPKIKKNMFYKNTYINWNFYGFDLKYITSKYDLMKDLCSKNPFFDSHRSLKIRGDHDVLREVLYKINLLAFSV